MAAPAARRTPLPTGLSEDALLEIYYYLRLTRSLEERLVNLYRQSKVIGGLYCSLGQEGQSVASAYALEPGDIVSPLIRNVGSMLVMGALPVDLLRQYMAKGTGPARGRDSGVHFVDLDRGYLGNISHLGDMVPVMAGIALSFKLRGERRVGLVYVGDGASSTGSFHEGMNFAAVQRVPLVVMVENNGYAYSTPTARQTAVKRLADKAKAYGVPAETVDGNDVFPVYEATKRAVDRARHGEGVTLIEVVTYRRKGHAEHDDQRYQPKEEREHWAKLDPIDRYVQRLVAEGWVDEAQLKTVDARVAAELDGAVATAENEPLPDGSTALGAVLANPPEAERLWFRRR
jgi:pyruvate dehydrogenase E1 component alpha subunit/2-oxoisovalerate dehydrogenase E1 component alpha subunit